MRLRTRRIGLCAALALAGCQTPAPRPNPTPVHTQVSYQAIADKSLGHYQIKPTQTAVAPLQLPHNPTPVYPPAQIANHLPPVSVTALLIVSAQGVAQEVRIGKISGVDATTAQAFASAVRSATLRWRFLPMHIDTWVDDANGGSHRVAAAVKPFSQTYRFHFAVHNGKPMVSMGAPNPEP